MDISKKLTAYLNALPPEDRDERMRLYHSILVLAQKHGFQSPRFWAARQIMTQRSPGQIDHEIRRRIRRQLNAT